MEYALIENGVVGNIIWLHPDNASDFENAVPVGDVPVEIGDTYADGMFYRDGELLLSSEYTNLAEKADMQSALNLLGVAADE